jgi:ribonuclease HI
MHRYSALVADEKTVPGVGEASNATASHAILWSDGAARGNPGPAGIGAILKSPNGEVLATESRFLGHTTNNIAEYRALLLGVTRALELGIENLEIRADSELLIKQLRGEYRVKNEGLKPLYAEAKQLLSRFRAVKLTHVRRELNVEADRLANRGIDEAG